VVQATSDLIALVDPQGRITFVSDSVKDTLGWDPNRLVGKDLCDLVHEDDVDAVEALDAPARGTTQLVTMRLPHAHGGWRTFEVGTSDHRRDPVIGALLLTARDVTERFELQQQLKFRSEHDSLTGLPNRTSLLVDGAALLASQQPGESLAVVLMDLDRFKNINDTLGHGYGDRLLKLVGPRLRPLVRDVDVLVRLGGDEFGVLLPRATLAGARAAAVRLRDGLTGPFELDDLILDVEASVGVAVSDGAGPHDIETLLRQADIAMYTAKELQSGVEVYNRDADTHDRAHLTLLSELRRGIADRQLVLHYQPKMCLKSGVAVGVEALVRWQHPTRGLLMPVDFLPAVEQTGLIEPLTTAVLDMAMTQIKVWSVLGIHLPVAVNLSARCLAHADLPDRILAQLQSFDIAPEMLRLELTESALMAQPQRAREILTRLHAAGVGLSIDDFGTGYSSMATCSSCPSTSSRSTAAS
jgi:diguanylate cyclase (GGDEF)-like protein/PAS domain S-box-containing protein